MEPRDVTPSIDVAKEQRDPIAEPSPTIEPRWLDIDTAAKYLCMMRHALYHQVARIQLPFVRHGSSPEIRSPGPRPLVREGGQVWLW